MKKTIVIFSNPFGYGPTGKAVAIAEAFLKHGHDQILIAGSSFVKEIIPKKFAFEEVDERNKDEVIKLLRNISEPLVISSQNRFAIHAAKELLIPCAFLDGLSWFWGHIPEDHLIADEIFWMNFPEISEKLPDCFANIHIVEGIIHTPDTRVKKDQTLVHIGGLKNPLNDIFPEAYLDILAQSLKLITSFEKVIVCGGEDATKYLSSKVKDNISCVSLEHDVFVNELLRSKHFVTTAGQTATLEAFALGIPTSFLPPTNLSQKGLVEVLNKFNAAPQSISLNAYLNASYSNLNEKEAISLYNTLMEQIEEDPNLAKRLVADLTNMINKIPDNRAQKQFIDRVGTNGAEQIRLILSDKWQLR